MKKLLARLFNRDLLGPDLGYEEARDVLESRNADLKVELSARTDAPREMLYYLAQDGAPEVRKNVAANPTTPMKASELLVDDDDDDVRSELARRIGRLAPDLCAEDQAQLRERTIALLEKLAEDRLPRVRAILAEEIKLATNLPADLIRRLAMDVELSVCGPILEYSPLLSDADLQEIMTASGTPGALAAIAKRKELGAGLVESLAQTLDVGAVVNLLRNPAAHIREETLDRLIGHAPDIEAWHGPLVQQPDLSLRAIRRIASFVARGLIEELSARHELDEETKKTLKEKALLRVAEDEPETVEHDEALAWVRARYEKGQLDDGDVARLASRRQADAIRLALCLLSGVSETAIVAMISAESGEALTAVCWRSGLSMRTAHAVQVALRIPTENVVLPRDGFSYPHSEERMEWYLNYFVKGGAE